MIEDITACGRIEWHIQYFIDGSDEVACGWSTLREGDDCTAGQRSWSVVSRWLSGCGVASDAVLQERRLRVVS